eukprot:TRINITY_DN60404_c0_g1_i1.p1 TRINITY_DN60404_c0_g1~~TRINITY_DN60404_c0_g1_i1.p1  ORF type:complete len:145 (-),score=37.40 TRINITY_DN60404_c0_g1_i1:70-474(-)
MQLMSLENPSLLDTSLLVPQEYQKIFVLESSSSFLQDQLEIYNTEERKSFISKKSSKMRKDSLKLLRKSIESRTSEEEKVTKKSKEPGSKKLSICYEMRDEVQHTELCLKTAAISKLTTTKDEKDSQQTQFLKS